MNVTKIELVDEKGRDIILSLDGSMDITDFMKLEEMLNENKIAVDILEYSKENK